MHPPEAPINTHPWRRRGSASGPDSLARANRQKAVEFDRQRAQAMGAASMSAATPMGPTSGCGCRANSVNAELCERRPNDGRRICPPETKLHRHLSGSTDQCRGEVRRNTKRQYHVIGMRRPRGATRATLHPEHGILSVAAKLRMVCVRPSRSLRMCCGHPSVACCA